MNRKLLLFSLLTLILLAALLPGMTPQASAEPASPPAATDFVQTGLFFAPAAATGETPAGFVAQTPEAAMAFGAGEIALAVGGQNVDAEPATVHLRFDAASPVLPMAGAELPGKLNYLLGDDPAQWRIDVPTYASIVYPGLYPGVDLVYDGQPGALKSTYHVAPGANPALIRWRYDGATALAVDAAAGDLQISLPNGRSLAELAPVAWQDIAGVRHPVTAAYDLAADGSIGFVLGAYDSAQPLVIDPYLVFATLFGGSGADEGRAIAVDASGATYITGNTLSANFPNAGPPQPGYGGSTSGNVGDAFIAKLNPAGTALVYMTYLGGSGGDIGDAIAVDGSGAVVVTGSTTSTNFPRQNAYQNSPGGNNCSAPPCSDAFVARLNPAGNGLIFSTYLGGSWNENGPLTDFGTLATRAGIAVDGAGNVYVTGRTDSPNFPTANAAYASRAGLNDLFLAKLSPNGQTLLYGSYLGGTGAEYGGDVAVDNAGNAYIAGGTLSTNFPTKNPLQGSNAGIPDAVAARFNTTASGNASLVWSTYFGGAHSDQFTGIALTGQGLVLTGYTLSTNYPTLNAFQATNGSAGQPNPYDAVVTVLNTAGSAVLYSTYLGGSGYDAAYGMDVNSQGHVFIAGRTNSDNFPTREPWQQARRDSNDMFAARLNPAQSGAASLVYSTYLGGEGSDIAYGLAVDGQNNAFVAGVTPGVTRQTFPVSTVIGPTTTSTGVLVARLSPNPTRRVYLPAVLVR